MNSILAVKTNFGGDIRRFSVSSRTPFKLIEESIGRFYNLDLGSFKICFLDSEGTPQTLTEECYHSLYTEYVEDSTKSILRLNIQAVVPVEQTKPEEPVTVVELPTNVLPPTENTSKTVQTESNENTSTSDVDLVALFENPQFEEKLMYLMTEAMASKTLMDFVKEGFVPSMISQMREIAIREKNRQVDEVKEIPQVQQTPPEEEKEVAPADSIEKTAEQQINEEVNQFVVVNDNTEETQPEAVENQNQETSDQQVVESPAQQVVESPETVEKLSSLIPNVPPEISSSPIKSFIYSLFKPIPKEPENLEEILEKLTAMGFTDREANIEAIKFHNKFNEGIDAIVEDLLLQSALNESKKSSQN